MYFRFVKCEKCSHFFVVLSDADAKNRAAKGQMGMDGPEIQNSQQGKAHSYKKSTHITAILIIDVKSLVTHDK